MLVFFASAMHIVWGCLLLIHGDSIATSATSTFRVILPDPYLRALCYITAALLPAALLRWPGTIQGLLSCLPQQLLLILSAISASIAITTGQYADGVARPVLFIAMDQVIYILLAILYSAESLDRYHDGLANGLAHGIPRF